MSTVMELLDLETERTREALRRLRKLGDQAEAEYDEEALSARAWKVRLRPAILRQWKHLYNEGGFEALKPAEWTELTHDQQCIILDRMRLLGSLTDMEIVEDDQLTERLKQLHEKEDGSTEGAEGTGSTQAIGNSIHTLKRYYRLYNIYGPWGLLKSKAPTEQEVPQVQNHTKRRRNAREEGKGKRELALLSEKELEEVIQWYYDLKPLLQKARVTESEALQYARRLGVSARTIRNKIADYKAYGKKGLARSARSDKGKFHGISDRMTRIVKAIRLSFSETSIPEIMRLVEHKALQLQEIVPTEGQVRGICAQISPAAMLLAQGKDDEFRSSLQITYRVKYKDIIYLIDIARVPVLVRDTRKGPETGRGRGRKKSRSGEIRPHFITVMEANSRALPSWRITAYTPTRFDITAAIRDAFLGIQNSSLGGKPFALWTDNGKQMIAMHVQEFCRQADVNFHRCRPRKPKEKARLERFFRTMYQLWSRLKGYVGPHPKKRNPHAKAVLTLDELRAKVDDFVKVYHRKRHRATKLSPLQYFSERCYTAPVENVRDLDVFLLEGTTCTVFKGYVKHNGGTYWNTALRDWVGREVLVRAGPKDPLPATVEVYDDKGHICTAVEENSKAGEQVTRAEVGQAQIEQWNAAKGEIKEAHDELRRIEQEIKERQRAQEPPVHAAALDLSSTVQNTVIGEQVSPDALADRNGQVQQPGLVSPSVDASPDAPPEPKPQKPLPKEQARGASKVPAKPPGDFLDWMASKRDDS